MKRVNRTVPIDELRPNLRNSRTHARKQVEAIAGSICACGFASLLIIDERRGLLAGHTRPEAAKEFGLTEIPAVQKRVLLIADGKLAGKAGWDRLKLTKNASDAFYVENLSNSHRGPLGREEDLAPVFQ